MGGVFITFDMREKIPVSTKLYGRKIEPLAGGFQEHKGLYDHRWVDENTVVVAYQNGTICTLDSRNSDSVIHQFKQEDTGGLENIDYRNGTLAVFSTGGATFYSDCENGWNLNSLYRPKYERASRNAGCFLRDSMAAVTAADSSLV